MHLLMAGEFVRYDILYMEVIHGYLFKEARWIQLFIILYSASLGEDNLWYIFLPFQLSLVLSTRSSLSKKHSQLLGSYLYWCKFSTKVIVSLVVISFIDKLVPCHHFAKMRSVSYSFDNYSTLLCWSYCNRDLQKSIRYLSNGFRWISVKDSMALSKTIENYRV